MVNILLVNHGAHSNLSLCSNLLSSGFIISATIVINMKCIVHKLRIVERRGRGVSIEKVPTVLG